MRLTFLGVRGSTPAPGREYVRYGGHTSCIAVTLDDEHAPTLVLDAGTGLRMLTPLLAGAPFAGTILLSHLHWDHVQGIPFFAGGDREGARVRVVVPAQLGLSGRDLVAQFLAPPAFPITPEGLNGQWGFEAVEPGELQADGYAIKCFEVGHKGGRTYGYRVTAGNASLAYLPDHAPAFGVTDAARAGMAGVDLLIHDAQFLAGERTRADDYGHATVDDAIELARSVRANSLMLFHHGPYRTDDQLDLVAADLSEQDLGVEVRLASEGMVVTL